MQLKPSVIRCRSSSTTSPRCILLQIFDAPGHVIVHIDDRARANTCFRHSLCPQTEPTPSGLAGKINAWASTFGTRQFAAFRRRRRAARNDMEEFVVGTLYSNEEIYKLL